MKVAICTTKNTNLSSCTSNGARYLYHLYIKYISPVKEYFYKM